MAPTSFKPLSVPQSEEILLPVRPWFIPLTLALALLANLLPASGVAWGWFTIGAEVEGQQLGLPLNTVPGAPEVFTSR